MSATNYLRCYKATLKHEGGYVNHPKDPGGATNFGVIQRVYDSYRKNKGLSTLSVKQISQKEVEEIYRLQYWNKVSGDNLPDGLDLVAYDAGVNSGPSRGVKWLQQALAIKVDGVPGQVTIDAANTANDKKGVVRKACAIRLGFLKRLGHWSTFSKGWTRRVVGVEALGVQMVIEAAASSVTTGIPVDVPVKPPQTIEEVIKEDAAVQTTKATTQKKKDTAVATGGAAAGGGSGTQIDPSQVGGDDIAQWIFIAVIAVGFCIFAFYMWRSYQQKIRAQVYEEVAKGNQPKE